MQVLNNINLSKLSKIKTHSYLLFCILSLVLTSVINIVSSPDPNYSNLFWIQVIWLIFSIVATVLICFIRTKNFELIAYPFYLIIIISLIAVSVYGLIVNGSRRWIDIGFLRFQPSEFAKISVIFAIAKFLTINTNQYRFRDLIRPFNISRPLVFIAISIILIIGDYPQISLGSFLFFLVGVVLLKFSIKQLKKEGFNGKQIFSLSDLIFLPFLFVLIEPDLGTAIIILGVSTFMILFSGVKVLSFIFTSCILIGISLISWNWIFEDYQRQRIFNFINPEVDIMGSGYHTIQSIIAIGSGGLWGKGLNCGTQTQLLFLPENHTDFAFAALSEEWGFFGTCTVLLLYVGLIFFMIKVAFEAKNQFSGLIAIGAASLLFWHFFMNVGMALGLLPVVGIPLPFVSYGGSAALIQIAALGICVNVALWENFQRYNK